MYELFGPDGVEKEWNKLDDQSQETLAKNTGTWNGVVIVWTLISSVLMILGIIALSRYIKRTR